MIVYELLVWEQLCCVQTLGMGSLWRKCPMWRGPEGRMEPSPWPQNDDDQTIALSLGLSHRLCAPIKHNFICNKHTLGVILLKKTNMFCWGGFHFAVCLLPTIKWVIR